MSKVFIEESTLTAIGNAIRGKEGTTALVPVNDMATRISAIETGSGGVELPEEAFNITGDCSYRFSAGGWDWFIENYGNKVTTQNITNCTSMFKKSQVEALPFVINVSSGYLFGDCFAESRLRQCPQIRGKLNVTTSLTFDGALEYCSYIRDFEDLFEPSMLDSVASVKVTSKSSCVKPPKFTSCTSMRRVPSWLSKFNLSEDSTVYPSATNGLYSKLFQTCYTLDEALDIPVYKCNAAQTSNMFSYVVDNANHLKRFTFEMPNGQPKVTEWKAQVIEMSANVGFNPNTAGIFYQYNSGITEDKRVTDDATYQALKNDPDWFTTDKAYSRYNHDSAVETINSLPDTSAYLASEGGTNTIKFYGVSGSATDGGAINTLTAEEIAVATAKGWTVTLS